MEKCLVKLYPDWGLLALRVGLAVPLIVHGWAKLQGVDEFGSGLASMGVPAPAVMAWVVTLVEFVGGLMILLGLCARKVSVLVAIQFLYILFAVKDWAIGGKGDVDFTIMTMAIALCLMGAGKYSLQAMWGKKPSTM